MKETSQQINKSPDNLQASEIKSPPSTSLYKVGFFVLLSLFLLATGGLGSWYYFSQVKREENIKATPTALPLAKRPSATPSPTPLPKKTVSPTSKKTPTTTTSQKSDLEQIKEAISARHGKSSEETIVNISKNTGTHAWGSVRFEGEIAGGWLLAAKRNGKWVIVDDGNGTISCEVIEPWDFPTSIVPECVDELGNLVTR